MRQGKGIKAADGFLNRVYSSEKNYGAIKQMSKGHFHPLSCHIGTWRFDQITSWQHRYAVDTGLVNGRVRHGHHA
jgi:hypothetical protein